MLSPCASIDRVVSASEDTISCNTAHIIRINQGELGLAFNNSNVEILLAGVHVRNSPFFQFHRRVAINDNTIQFGGVSIFTVKSGQVRIANHHGIVKVYSEGRYNGRKGMKGKEGTSHGQPNAIQYARAGAGGTREGVGPCG